MQQGIRPVSDLTLSFDLSSLCSQLQEPVTNKSVVFLAKAVWPITSSVSLEQTNDPCSKTHGSIELDAANLTSLFCSAEYTKSLPTTPLQVPRSSSCQKLETPHTPLSAAEMQTLSCNAENLESLRSTQPLGPPNSLVLAEGGEEYPYDCMRAISNIFNNNSGARNCLVCLTYAILNCPEKTNNFAGLLLITHRDGVLTMMHPWSGPYWENLHIDNCAGDFDFKSYIISRQEHQNLADQNQDWRVLLVENEKRSIMNFFYQHMKPFMTTGRRLPVVDVPENIESWHPQTYTRFCPFYMQISDLHRCFDTQLPRAVFDLVVEILKSMHAFDVLPASSHDEGEFSTFRVDLFWACVVQALKQISGAYRPDYYGEDQGHAFDALPLKQMTHSSPLIAGGDCEDFAKTLLQFNRTRCEVTQNIANPFCIPNNFYIARVACFCADGSSNAKEDNHTCGALLHSNLRRTQIRIIESTVPQIVLPRSMDDNTCADLRMQCPGVSILTERQCAQRFRFVYILGEFLVFEFMPVKGTYSLHLGAEPFFDYAGHLFIRDSDDNRNKVDDFFDNCRKGAARQAPQRLKNENGQQEQRWLLLIEEVAFYRQYDTFLNVCVDMRAQTRACAWTEKILDYCIFSRNLCEDVLRGIFAENTEENNKRAKIYMSLHEEDKGAQVMNAKQIACFIESPCCIRMPQVQRGRPTVSNTPRLQQQFLECQRLLNDLIQHLSMIIYDANTCISSAKTPVCIHCSCLDRCLEENCIIQLCYQNITMIKENLNSPKQVADRIGPVAEQCIDLIRNADKKKNLESAYVLLTALMGFRSTIAFLAQADVQSATYTEF